MAERSGPGHEYRPISGFDRQPHGDVGNDAVALQALCHGAMSWQLLEELKHAGARGLMVLPVERMLV